MAVFYGKGGIFCAGWDLSDLASVASNEEVQDILADPSEGPMVWFWFVFLRFPFSGLKRKPVIQFHTLKEKA